MMQHLTASQLFSGLPTIPLTDDLQEKPILLLTHNDLDGAVPEIILHYLTDNVWTKHCTNAVMDEEIMKAALKHIDEYSFIIVTDISCSEETARLIDASAARNKILLLDHHISAEYLNKFSWACVYSYMPSGSTFGTNYYTPETLPNARISASGLLYLYLIHKGFLNPKTCHTLSSLVELTSCYDTWDWYDLLHKLPASEALNDLFYAYGSKEFKTNMLQRCIANANIFSKFDTRFLALQNRNIADTVERISKSYIVGDITIENDNYSLVLCFSDQYPGRLLVDMRERYPDRDLYLLRTSNGISLRATKPEINVAVIAAKFGGGGHPQASGISIDCHHNIAFLEQYMNAAINIEIAEHN